MTSVHSTLRTLRPLLQAKSPVQKPCFTVSMLMQHQANEVAGKKKSEIDVATPSIGSLGEETLQLAQTCKGLQKCLLGDWIAVDLH